MKQLILAVVIILSFPIAFASIAISTEEVDEPKSYNPLKSHFFFGLNFEGTKYKVPFNFPGVKSKFEPRMEDLWGARITFGGDLYLGRGFVTSSRLEGFYVGTLFSEVLNGGSVDADVKFANTKKNSQLGGVEISQSIGYIFNMKTKHPIMGDMTYLNVEPFIEAGIGKAWAYNKISYLYALPASGTDEAYDAVIRDDLMNAKLSVGVNFTASNNFYFFMKATQNRFDLTQRNTKQTVKPNGSNATRSESNAKPTESINAVTTYAIGGGYKF